MSKRFAMKILAVIFTVTALALAACKPTADETVLNKYKELGIFSQTVKATDVVTEKGLDDAFDNMMKRPEDSATGNTAAATAEYVNKTFLSQLGAKNVANDKITYLELAKLIDANVATIYSKTGEYTVGTVNGNVIINTDGITLKDGTIKGNLIIAEGVGEGNAHLNDIAVTGTVFTRGGGVNSIYFDGSASADDVIIQKPDGKVRVVFGGKVEVKTTTIEAGIDVLLCGNIGAINLNSSNTVLNLVNADVETLTINVPNAVANIAEDSQVEIIAVTPEAQNLALDISGTADSVTTAAPQTNITIGGTANNVTTTAPQTNITVSGNAQNITTTAEQTNITVSGTTSNITAGAGSQGTTVTATETAQVNKVETAGQNTVITGDGKIDAVDVQEGSTGTEITAPVEEVKVDEKATGTKVDGLDVQGGTTVTPTYIGFSVRWENLTFVYDGKAHVPAANAGNYPIVVTGNQTAAGKYTATATCSAENTKILNPTIEFEITKAPLNVSISKTEDGTANFTAVITNGVVSGETVSITGATSSSAAGKYDLNSATYTLSGNTSANYYVSELSVEIVARQQTVATVVWGTTTTFEYDGFIQAPTATAEGVQITVTGGQSSVGTYTATATVVGSNNMTLENATIQYTITKRGLTYIFSKVEDGTATFSGRLTTGVSGETMMISGSTNSAEAGTYGINDITYEFTGEGKENYSLTTAKITITHNLTLVSPNAATCTLEGNTAYWVCSHCSKIFSNSSGTIEITLADTVIPKIDHIDQNNDGVCDRPGCGYDTKIMVGTYAELVEAIDNVATGKTIQLTANVAPETLGSLNIVCQTRSYDFKLDLNGFRLGTELKLVAANYSTYVGGVSGNFANFDGGYGIKLSIIDSSVAKTGTIGSTDSAAISLAGGSYVRCYYGIRIYANDKLDLTLSDITLEGYYGGMQTNGSYAGGATITASNCTFKGNGAVKNGAYLAGKQNYTFTSCVFTGDVGLYTKSGTYSISSTSFIGTSAYTAPTYAGSGAEGTGSALVIDSASGYKQTLNFTLTDCAFASTHGYGIEEASTSVGVSYASVTVTNPTFNTCALGNVISANNTVTVSGTILVGTYSELVSAIKYTANGSTIKLTNNISGFNGATYLDDIDINAKAANLNRNVILTLDLNSYTLSAEVNVRTADGFTANVTIKDSSAAKTGKIGALTSSDLCYGLLVNGNAATVTLSDVAFEGYYGGFYTNGTFSGTTTITASNCTFKCTATDDNLGSYLAAGYTYNFTNCTFTGASGIHIKSAVNSTFTGCTFVANMTTSVAPTYNGNGANPTGDAFMAEATAGGYTQTLNVTLTNCTFSSVAGYGIQEASTCAAGGTESPYAAITVSNPTFNTCALGSVKSKNDAVVILVATNTALTNASLTSDGSTIKLLNNVTGTDVEVAAGHNVVLDLNGFTLTANITNNGTLKITNGTLVAPDGNTKHLIANSGNMTIDDVDCSAPIIRGKAIVNNAGTSEKPANLTVVSGSFAFDGRTENTSTLAAGWYLIYNGTYSTMTINGGEFNQKGVSASLIDNNGNLSITSGTFLSNFTILKNEPTSVVTSISGGTFTIDEYGEGGSPVVLNYSRVDSISNGTFAINYCVKPTQSSSTIYSHASTAQEASMSISGGTFRITALNESCEYVHYVVRNYAEGTYNSTLSISGGDFYGIAGTTSVGYTVYADSKSGATGKPVTIISGGNFFNKQVLANSASYKITLSGGKFSSTINNYYCTLATGYVQMFDGTQYAVLLESNVTSVAEAKIGTIYYRYASDAINAASYNSTLDLYVNCNTNKTLGYEVFSTMVIAEDNLFTINLHNSAVYSGTVTSARDDFEIVKSTVGDTLTYTIKIKQAYANVEITRESDGSKVYLSSTRKYVAAIQQAGDTVKLLNSLSGDKTVSSSCIKISKNNVTIDLNGNTIEGTSTLFEVSASVTGFEFKDGTLITTGTTASKVLASANATLTNVNFSGKNGLTTVTGTLTVNGGTLTLTGGDGWTTLFSYTSGGVINIDGCTISGINRFYPTTAFNPDADTYGTLNIGNLTLASGTTLKIEGLTKVCVLAGKTLTVSEGATLELSADMKASGTLTVNGTLKKAVTVVGNASTANRVLCAGKITIDSAAILNVGANGVVYKYDTTDVVLTASTDSKTYKLYDIYRNVLATAAVGSTETYTSTDGGVVVETGGQTQVTTGGQLDITQS